MLCKVLTQSKLDSVVKPTRTTQNLVERSDRSESNKCHHGPILLHWISSDKRPHQSGKRPESLGPKITNQSGNIFRQYRKFLLCPETVDCNELIITAVPLTPNQFLITELGFDSSQGTSVK